MHNKLKKFFFFLFLNVILNKLKKNFQCQNGTKNVLYILIFISTHLIYLQIIPNKWSKVRNMIQNIFMYPTNSHQ